jgi:radical SAM superfamily enzyme YgiQ (UPF0313 family)
MKHGNTVILVYPRLVEGDHTEKTLPPLSLLSLSGSLKELGIEVKLYDLRNFENYEILLKSFTKPPICFGISAMISNQVRDGAFFSEFAHKIFPGVPIVWGGWFTTILPHIAISHSTVDILVRGQGEVTFKDLVETLLNGGDLSEIKGITYKRNGKVFINPPREPVDPNSLPPVDYSIVDISSSTLSDGLVNYTSSTGCPHRCKFCNVQLAFGRKWMPLSADRVLDDIERLVKYYKVNMVDFYDDNFFVNIQRLRVIINGFIKRKLNIRWIANCRVDQFLRLNEEDIRLIQSAGCHTLTFGAESGNQYTLDFLQKDTKADQIEEVAKRLRSHNIIVRYNFLVGAPRETPSDFQNTLKFILKLKKIHPDLEIVFYYYMPVPESKLKKEDIKMGFKQHETFEEWSNFILGDVTQPWLFHVDESIMEDRRDKFKYMSYYFWRGYLLHDTNSGPLLQHVKRKIIKFLSRLRIKTDFYAFPFEWELYKRHHKSRRKK